MNYRTYYYNTRRMLVTSLSRRSSRRAVKRRSQPHPLTFPTLKEQNSLTFQRHRDTLILGPFLFPPLHSPCPLSSISILSTLSPHLQLCDPLPTLSIPLEFNFDFIHSLIPPTSDIPLPPIPHPSSIHLDFNRQIYSD